MFSTGQQEVKSSFDEKEDETKDGLLCIFDYEEGFLRIFSLEASLELHTREGCGIDRVSHLLPIWIVQI